MASSHSPKRQKRKVGNRHLFRAPQPFENTQLSGAKRAVCPRFFDFFTASQRGGRVRLTAVQSRTDSCLSETVLQSNLHLPHRFGARDHAKGGWCLRVGG